MKPTPKKTARILDSGLCVLLFLLMLGGAPALEAGKASREAAVRSRVERYIRQKKASYVAKTERLRRLLRSQGLDVKAPLPILQLPEPREILITVTRDIKRERIPPVPLGSNDFLCGVKLFRPPQPKHWPELHILDAPEKNPSTGAFWREWKVGSVYAADDQTTQLLGIPRSIPIRATGSVLHYTRIVGTLANWDEYTRKSITIAKVPCSRVTASKAKGADSHDLTGMIVAGRSPGKIELNLQGANLEYRPDGHRLVPSSPGPIHMPTAKIYAQTCQTISILPQFADFDSRSPSPRMFWAPFFNAVPPNLVVRYPEVQSRLPYDGTHIRFSSSRKEMDVPFGHWRQKPN